MKNWGHDVHGEENAKRERGGMSACQTTVPLTGEGGNRRRLSSASGTPVENVRAQPRRPLPSRREPLPKSPFHRAPKWQHGVPRSCWRHPWPQRESRRLNGRRAGARAGWVRGPCPGGRVSVGQSAGSACFVPGDPREAGAYGWDGNRIQRILEGRWASRRFWTRPIWCCRTLDEDDRTAVRFCQRFGPKMAKYDATSVRALVGQGHSACFCAGLFLDVGVP